MNSTNRHVEVIRKLPSLRKKKKKAKGSKKFFLSIILAPVVLLLNHSPSPSRRFAIRTHP